MDLKKRIIAVLLCVMLCLCAFSGCEFSQLTCVSEPTLTLYGEYPYQLPVLKGFSGATELTQRLEEHYGEICSLLQSANASGEVVSIDYSLEKREENYVLRSFIKGTQSGSFLLDEIVINTEGTTQISPIAMTEYLSDGEFLASYFMLCEAGLDPDLGRYGEKVDLIDLLSVLVGYCEAYGEPIDTTRISQSVSGSDVYLKAYETGLVDLLFEDDLYSQLRSYQLAQCMASFIEYASSHICTVSSNEITMDELMSMCDVFLDFYTPAESEEATTQWESCKAEIMECYSSDGLDVPATRSNAAESFVYMYETCFGEIDEDTYDWVTYLDTELTAARKAGAKSLMSPFPSGDIFSAQYIIHEFEIGDIASDFAYSCYTGFCEDFAGEDSYAAETAVYYGEMIKCIGTLDEYIKAHTAPETQKITVRNDRDYDWYLTQYDYSYYADVNCMPTISAMAIRWSTGDLDVTQHELRKKFLPEYSQGWWMWQVEECLADYGVKYESKDVSIESMLSDLDAGCIILTQMSEVDLSLSGHCFIIYGYRKLGDSVVFYIHDPGVSYEQNKYGEPIGKGMEIDSAYAYWVIDRFAYSYVCVSAQ